MILFTKYNEPVSFYDSLYDLFCINFNIYIKEIGNDPLYGKNFKLTAKGKDTKNSYHFKHCKCEQIYTGDDWSQQDIIKNFAIEFLPKCVKSCHINFYKINELI